jgi:hypothetical protein
VVEEVGVKLPTLVDYQQAVQAPAVTFLDDALRTCVPRLTPLGTPAVVTGGFALTFDLSGGGRRYAVRCFHRQADHLESRYAEVAAFVRSTPLDFLVGVNYLPAGIRVRDEVYPVVRMEWIAGARLDDWVQSNLGRPEALDRARRGVVAAALALRRNGAAHGDLQHGNILVMPDQSIKLIDYDGMYLPSLSGLGASEQGHRNYQHPDRSDQYDAALDRFAVEIIGVSLGALAVAPTLWQEFNTGENIIFSAADFAEPSSSDLFTRLERLPEVADAVRRLRRACEVGYGDITRALESTSTAPAPGRAPGGRRAGARPAASGPDILRATDRSALLFRQGDEVTVVGKVVRTHQIQRSGTITFINFGDYRTGAFTVVCWDRTSRGLASVYGDLSALDGRWVRVTGMVTIYKGRSGMAPLTPQIELGRANMLRVLTPDEARVLLAGNAPARHPTATRTTEHPGTTGHPATAGIPGTAGYPGTTPVSAPNTQVASAGGGASGSSRPAVSGPVSGGAARADRDARLGSLYSHLMATGRVANPPSSPSSSSPTSPAGKPPGPAAAANPASGASRPGQPGTSAAGSGSARPYPAPSHQSRSTPAQPPAPGASPRSAPRPGWTPAPGQPTWSRAGQGAAAGQQPPRRQPPAPPGSPGGTGVAGRPGATGGPGGSRGSRGRHQRPAAPSRLGQRSVVCAVLGFVFSLATFTGPAAAIAALPTAFAGVALAAVSMMSWRPGDPWSSSYVESAGKVWIARTQALVAAPGTRTQALTRDEILAVVGLWGGLLDTALNVLGVLVSGF